MSNLKTNDILAKESANIYRGKVISVCTIYEVLGMPN
jgi:hypothetical protein